MDSSHFSYISAVHCLSRWPLNVQLYNCNQEKDKFLCFTFQGKIKSVKLGKYDTLIHYSCRRRVCESSLWFMEEHWKFPVWPPQSVSPLWGFSIFGVHGPAIRLVDKHLPSVQLPNDPCLFCLLLLVVTFNLSHASWVWAGTLGSDLTVNFLGRPLLWRSRPANWHSSCFYRGAGDDDDDDD